ncbi:MAG: hypothetical protein KM310_10620 [Clostridiales bacterium]|nr:hypothetical protein [Clostridiales bacterium]
MVVEKKIAVLTPDMVRARYLCLEKELEGVRFDWAWAVYDVRESDEEIFARPPAPWGENLYAEELAEFAEGLRNSWFGPTRSKVSVMWYFDAREPKNRNFLVEALEGLQAYRTKYRRPIVVVANFGAGIIEAEI